ncbi:hypothetical protein H0H93_009118, partial [Arthromyces matolae]
DLMIELIDLYFLNANLFLPLLHRPTFEKALAERLHLHDEGFAAVLLLVCAVASRYSDDPRTLIDGVRQKASAGWKWYHQVQSSKKNLLAFPLLYDLQYYCVRPRIPFPDKFSSSHVRAKLAVMFLLGTSAKQQCWILVGIGIRMAQEVGAHRKKLTPELTVEDELWKRGFWCLVAMDRMHFVSVDLDLPVECDDEYWENPDPTKCFKQPPDKPSYITGFVVLLKLYQVLAIVLRTIYSIDKSKVILGLVGKHWEQPVVAELDSALNSWVESIPDHPGLVLLLNIWNNKHLGITTNEDKAMDDVFKCMQSIQLCETRDFMYELAFVGDLHLPDSSSGANALEHGREPDETFDRLFESGGHPQPDVPIVSWDSSQITPSSSMQMPHDNLGVPASGNGAIAQLVAEPDRFDALSLPSFSQEFVDDDEVAMWSNPPLGFELDDWGAYLSNFSDLTHGSQGPS